MVEHPAHGETAQLNLDQPVYGGTAGPWWTSRFTVDQPVYGGTAGLWGTSRFMVDQPVYPTCFTRFVLHGTISV